MLFKVQFLKITILSLFVCMFVRMFVCCVIVCLFVYLRYLFIYLFMLYRALLCFIKKGQGDYSAHKSSIISR